MNVPILLCQMEHVHIKMILMLVAGKDIDWRVRLVLRQPAAKPVAIYPVPTKIIKDQNFLIYLYHKTTVMYKNYLHRLYLPLDFCLFHTANNLIGMSVDLFFVKSDLKLIVLIEDLTIYHGHLNILLAAAVDQIFYDIVFRLHVRLF